MTGLVHGRKSSCSRWFEVFLRLRAALALLVIGLSQFESLAEDAAGDEATRRFAARAAAEFQSALKRYQLGTNKSEAAWQLGRAAYDLAEYATNNAHRAALAEQGIVATRALNTQEPAHAAAQYYLAMNLGQLARTKTLGALKLVDQMEILFQRARELDPRFDYAGPDRFLGLLYRDAPGWPASIGSDLKARQHLLRAVHLEPNYPENRLNLAESLVKWSEHALARQELEAVNALWPKAQSRLTGETWEASWADWEKRRTELQRKIEGTLPKDQILKRGRVPQLN